MKADPVSAPTAPADGHATDAARLSSGGFGDEARPRTVGVAADWSRLGHDLRTPLNAVLGNVELLLAGAAGPLAAEARGCLDQVQIASRQLMREADRLLLLAQVLSATAPPSSAVVDLADLLARAEQGGSLRSQRPQAKIAPLADRFVVRGDPAWLAVLAGELVEMSRMAAGTATARLQKPSGEKPHQFLLVVSWPDFDVNQLSSVALTLTDAILVLHEGRLERRANGLWLGWPRSRMACLPESVDSPRPLAGSRRTRG